MVMMVVMMPFHLAAKVLQGLFQGLVCFSHQGQGLVDLGRGIGLPFSPGYLPPFLEFILMIMAMLHPVGQKDS